METAALHRLSRGAFAEPHYARRTMRVLAVDDQAEVLELVERALRRDGHTVLTAGSVARAHELMREQTFDALVLDLALPDGSGKQLCVELRGAGNALPILVLTANSAVLSRVECLDAGADDYLSKPLRSLSSEPGCAPSEAHSGTRGVRYEQTASWWIFWPPRMGPTKGRHPSPPANGP